MPAQIAAQSTPERSISVFGGLMTDQVWEDIFLNPAGLSFRETQIVGGASAWI